MSFTINIDIPALDRLCDILEDRGRAGLLEAIKNEIVAKLKEAAGNGTLEKAAKAPEPKPEPKPATASETRKGPQEPPKPKPTNAPATTEASKPDVAPVTLEAIQRAAAQMRDAGKLGAVTAMFPEFGIVRLSDLKADQLPVFAERLRGMGAEL